MTNTLIAVLLVVTLVSVSMVIGKNTEIEEKQKEIDEIKDYTTSRWGFAMEIEIDRLKKNLNKERVRTESYERTINEINEEYGREIRAKEAYYSKLIQIILTMRRLKNFQLSEIMP